VVTPDYFRTMGIPLLRGRYLTDRDGPGGPQVMIVSQTTATKFWGSEDPLGRTIRSVGSKREFTVVGVVGDARNTALNREPGPAVYMSVAARVLPSMDVVVRTGGKPQTALAGVREKVRELDRELPLSTVRTMDEWLAASAAQPRINTTLPGIFAGMALLIASIGCSPVTKFSALKIMGLLTRNFVASPMNDDVCRRGCSALRSGVTTRLYLRDDLVGKPPFTFGYVAIGMDAIANQAELVL
jgi:putative ABC transport system permease protein